MGWCCWSSEPVPASNVFLPPMEDNQSSGWRVGSGIKWVLSGSVNLLASIPQSWPNFTYGFVRGALWGGAAAAVVQLAVGVPFAVLGVYGFFSSAFLLGMLFGLASGVANLFLALFYNKTTLSRVANLFQQLFAGSVNWVTALSSLLLAIVASVPAFVINNAVNWGHWFWQVLNVGGNTFNTFITRFLKLIAFLEDVAGFLGVPGYERVYFMNTTAFYLRAHRSKFLKIMEEQGGLIVGSESRTDLNQVLETLPPEQLSGFLKTFFDTLSDEGITAPNRIFNRYFLTDVLLWCLPAPVLWTFAADANLAITFWPLSILSGFISHNFYGASIVDLRYTFPELCRWGWSRAESVGKKNAFIVGAVLLLVLCALSGSGMFEVAAEIVKLFWFDLWVGAAAGLVNYAADISWWVSQTRWQNFPNRGQSSPEPNDVANHLLSKRIVGGYLPLDEMSELVDGAYFKNTWVQTRVEQAASRQSLLPEYEPVPSAGTNRYATFSPQPQPSRDRKESPQYRTHNTALNNDDYDDDEFLNYKPSFSRSHYGGRR